MRRTMTCLIATLLLGSTAAGASPEAAIKDTHRPAADVARDADRKPAEMLEFAHVGPGKKVVDFLPGGNYFTRLFAIAVKPGGSVIAVVPAAAAARDKTGAIVADPAYGNVTIASGLGDPVMTGLDVVWTAQNYHDLHNTDAPVVAGANKAAFNALKPGGYYVIVDHAALPGATDATKKLHRIDPAVVKAEVTAAGFVFDGESKVLANPADDHSKPVFDPSIRGHTDQFAYRFRKP
nr:methyltransferase [Polymorphobacter sp.]